MPISTDRLLLRPWGRADAEPFAELNADPDVMRFIGAGHTLDRPGSDALLERVIGEWDARGHGLWAVEEDGELLGFCGLSVPMFLPQVLPSVEVGWRLRRAAWGRGIATEAARAALAWGFRQGMREIVAIVHPDNDRSLRVTSKLGMEPRPDRVHPGLGIRLRVMAASATSVQ
jgi:RimJ/RimL family protein N-acetyltransferase